MKKQSIHLNNLAIGYKAKENIKIVAEHITADIFNGELTCLLGANGVGKSTLLRTLSAFQSKLSGQIYLNGKEIDYYTEKDLSKLIAVVLTEKCDVKNMTARELIGLGRSPYTGFWGNLNDEDYRKVDNAISLVKIEDLSKRFIDTLSDGEQQKVIIAKALAQETPIIFLDEPTAFLDFPSKVEIMQLLHRLSRTTGKIIFLSTHDLELALQIGDRIWLMDKQSGIQIGIPEDLSLDGSLSNFFARKGIIFDQDTGLFRVENETNRKIKLIGDGHKYTMIRKALSRNGIFASDDAETDEYIRIEEKSYLLSLSNKSPVSVNTIDQLLTHFVEQ